MSKAADLVSVELRTAEAEIDRSCEHNALMRLTYGDAAWRLLAACEEHLLLRPRVWGSSVPDQFALSDNFINDTKWSLAWIKRLCPPGDLGTHKYQDESYAAAMELVGLAHRYVSFESAFTYASLGLTSLQLVGRRIKSVGVMRADCQYEAYDRLQDLLEKEPQSKSPGGLMQALSAKVRVKGAHFTYPLNRTYVEAALEAVRDTLGRRFALPEKWDFGDYNLGDYARVAGVLLGVSLVHVRARLIAADKGCIGMGYDRALVVTGRQDLVRNVAAWSEVEPTKVDAVIRDLTYGAVEHSGMSDPALQPLVQLRAATLGWSPSLLVSNNQERNLLVLMNRRKEARRLYSEYSNQRSDLLKARLEAGLADAGVRFWHGSIREWEGGLDIDLAIVSDTERQCILLELKSFLAPADPREIHDRSKEIAKGVAQVRRRRDLAQTNPEPLLRRLAIDSEYSFQWAVISETSVGSVHVQDQSVAVVRSSDFVRSVRKFGGLRPVARWLADRAYLPVEGREFVVLDHEVEIAGWTLEAFGIRLTESSPS